MTSSPECHPGLFRCDEQSKLQALDKVKGLGIRCSVENMDSAFLMATRLTD